MGVLWACTGAIAIGCIELTILAAASNYQYTGISHRTFLVDGIRNSPLSAGTKVANIINDTSVHFLVVRSTCKCRMTLIQLSHEPAYTKLSRLCPSS